MYQTTKHKEINCKLGGRVTEMCSVLSRIGHVQFFVTLWTIACQAPLYGILQAGILCGFLYLPPEDLPDPGIEPTSLMPPALAGGFFTNSGTTNKMKASNNCKHDQRTQEKNG